MRHVKLGRTGLPVSRLCLGTMTFGRQCDEATSHAILDRALATGITFLDTADVYPLGGTPETVGRTEEIVGRWLRGRRHDVIVATKCSGSTGRRPWDRGASRKHVLDAIEGSLRRLGTDHVDLYQVHHPDAETPVDETLRALDDIVRAGKARYVGCSNYFAYRVARAIGRSEVLGVARFDSVQPATTSCSARSSASSCRCARRRASASSRTTRSPAGCSPASTRAAAPPPRARASPSAPPARATRTATGTIASSRRWRTSGRSPRTPASRWRGWP